MTKFEEEFKALTSWDWLNVDLVQQILTRFGNWHSDGEFQELLSKYSGLNHNYEKEVIRSSKLESQIIDLKSQLQQQALPVVPECVGKMVEYAKKTKKSIRWFFTEDAYMFPEAMDWYAGSDKGLVDDIYAERQCSLINAFITGKYEVEKPQLFKLIFPNSTAVLQKDGELNSFADTVYKRYLIENAMTEQEIKSIDERYWQFAVPVEDGE